MQAKDAIAKLSDALYDAIDKNQYKAIKDLARKLAKTNSLNQLPAGRKYGYLHHAVYSRKLRVIRILVDEKIDVLSLNGYGETALHMAAFCNTKVNISILSMLLNPANVATKSTTKEISIFHKAVYGDAIDVLSYLLIQFPEHIDIKDRYNNTPLYVAIKERKSLQLIELLLQKGASTEVIPIIIDPEIRVLIERYKTRPENDSVSNEELDAQETILPSFPDQPIVPYQQNDQPYLYYPYYEQYYVMDPNGMQALMEPPPYDPQWDYYLNNNNNNCYETGDANDPQYSLIQLQEENQFYKNECEIYKAQVEVLTSKLKKTEIRAQRLETELKKYKKSNGQKKWGLEKNNIHDSHSEEERDTFAPLKM